MVKPEVGQVAAAGIAALAAGGRPAHITGEAFSCTLGVDAGAQTGYPPAFQTMSDQMAEKPTKAAQPPKEKKKRVGPLTFLAQVRAEGNKVTWTTRQETIQATIFVIIMSILIAIFLFTADQLIMWFVNFIRGA